MLTIGLKHEIWGLELLEAVFVGWLFLPELGAHRCPFLLDAGALGFLFHPLWQLLLPNELVPRLFSPFRHQKAEPIIKVSDMQLSHYEKNTNLFVEFVAPSMVFPLDDCNDTGLYPMHGDVEPLPTNLLITFLRRVLGQDLAIS